MSRGTGTHFENPVLGSKDLYEDVPIDILARTQRMGYFSDFVEPNTDSTSGQMNSTTLTGVTSSAVVASAPNGIYRVVTDGTTAHGIGSLQAIGTAATFAPAQASLTAATTAAIDGNLHRVVSFGCLMSISDFSNVDWFVGLAGIDSTLILGTGLLATTGFDNGVGFHHIVHANAQGGLTGPDGGAGGNVYRFASAGGGVANYAATLSTAGNVATIPAQANSAVDGVMIEFGLRIISTNQVEYYVNRSLKHRATLANALASTLVPSWGFIDNGASVTVNIDYFWMSQSRV